MDRTNVMQEKWDYLIILDACRYDYFEQVYRNYVQGELTKKISIGSSTDEWRDKSFPDYYDDVVYISANPMFSAASPVYGFLASKHFYKVYEVWKDGWDKDKGTVLPETLTNAAIDIIKNTGNKRFIIHYLQPHEPYLMPEIDSRGYDKGDINSDRVLIGSQKYDRFFAIKKKLLKNLLKLFSKERIQSHYPEWVLRQLLRMSPRCAMDAIRRYYGREVLRKAYKDNLERVLEQVAVLLGHLSGEIVITSDHGELLGDNNRYAHPLGSSNPILLEVPWLVVEKEDESTKRADLTAENRDIKKIQKTGSNSDEESRQKELAEKLRALGYYD